MHFYWINAAIREHPLVKIITDEVVLMGPIRIAFMIRIVFEYQDLIAIHQVGLGFLPGNIQNPVSCLIKG